MGSIKPKFERDGDDFSRFIAGGRYNICYDGISQENLPSIMFFLGQSVSEFLKSKPEDPSATDLGDIVSKLIESSKDNEVEFIRLNEESKNCEISYNGLTNQLILSYNQNPEAPSECPWSSSDYLTRQLMKVRGLKSNDEISCMVIAEEVESQVDSVQSVIKARITNLSKQETQRNAQLESIQDYANSIDKKDGYVCNVYPNPNNNRELEVDVKVLKTGRIDLAKYFVNDFRRYIMNARVSEEKPGEIPYPTNNIEELFSSGLSEKSKELFSKELSPRMKYLFSKPVNPEIFK